MLFSVEFLYFLQGVNCAQDQKCIVVETSGGLSIAPYVGHCVLRCPLPQPCTLQCEHGKVMDGDGCELCECYDPCKVSCVLIYFQYYCPPFTRSFHRKKVLVICQGNHCITEYYK